LFLKKAYKINTKIKTYKFKAIKRYKKLRQTKVKQSFKHLQFNNVAFTIK